MTILDKTANPPRARPQPGLSLPTPKSEAFLRLPLEERRRRLDEVGRVLRQALTGVSVDDLLHEKRREAAREIDCVRNDRAFVKAADFARIEVIR